ncbi:hypothetical protein K503DRAFT_748044 [Rhizopogon vinicolor AM-OR11-026]|uniref:F-box domain-containing protein n=1 Tax=Rhizopogon vinicolor AM-OR11-026 TaxID=1314800 RepID=A0A1B7MMY8_9AGAM|nr:hypothetical protein K503DRAFT_748044 [Rhizopogon vinicolor AM-OR11-026]
MNLLWADMDTIVPLLGCVTRLHPLIYHRNRERPWSSEGVEPLSETEAHQFLRHAARVQSLKIWEDHIHLLTVLIQKCFFLRLLRLHWQPENTGHLNLFLSPILRHCSLPAIHSDLGSVATCCPVLESLSIGTVRLYTADELSLLSDTVRSCRQLVDLCCPCLDFAAWKHLSDLPTLLTVRIQDHDTYHRLDWENLYFARFLNLNILDLCVRTCTDAITVMQHSEFPSLKEFRIYVYVFPWVEAEQLCRALSLCKACNLERIEISTYCPADQERFSEQYSTAIKTFLPFPQLRTLRLSLHCPIYLDNDLLLEAVSHWPHISHLKLNRPRFPSPPPAVTFRGLFAALRECPNLQILQVSIDAVNIDIDPTVESFQHTSLQSLDVCNSPIVDPEVVARIISSMLPCIYTIGYDDSDDSDDSDQPNLWHTVNCLICRNA